MIASLMPEISVQHDGCDCSQPLRILFLTDAFLPHAGGARVYYYNLLREMARQRLIEATVLTKKVPGWKQFDRRENCQELRIVRGGRPLETWRYHEWPKIAGPLTRAASLIARRKFDLIHFGDLFPQGVMSLWFKKILGIPYVAYCHGEEITQTDGRRYQPRVRDAIYREAEVIVAANEFARQNLLRIGMAQERIEKITPGVDCLRFQPTERDPDLVRRYGLEGKTTLLTVSRLVPRKGHRMVLQALRKLIAEAPNLAYLIVGTGPEEERLRAAVSEWSLTESVRFAGYVKDEDLARFYNVADIYVMPNSEERGDIEGFGMVFLEANACGKPVIAGRSGGAAEAVVHGKTGLLVDPNDAAELADAVRLLCQDRARATDLGNNGLLRARADFNWETRARQLDRINRSVVNAVRARRTTPR